MATISLRDVFRHGLGDIYHAEQQILSTLDQIETETESASVRDRIRQHRGETQRHIENLERCFELLGTHAPHVECSAIRGLQKEKELFQKEGAPSRNTLEIFNLGLAYRVEHYEIATYRALILQVQSLGDDDIRRLLDQNLRQEEEMARWLEQEQSQFLEELQRVRR